MSDDRSADADDAADGDEVPGRQRQPASAAARRERLAAQRSGGGPDGRTERRATRSGVRDTSGSPVQRVVRFLREVVAELRKVIWPTRKQVVTYTAVVLVFVSFMVAFVSGLDVGLAKLVLYVFG